MCSLGSHTFDTGHGNVVSFRSRFVLGNRSPTLCKGTKQGPAFKAPQNALSPQFHERVAPLDAKLHGIWKEEDLDKAMDLLDRHGPVPTVNVYLSLLKTCARRKALAQAKRVSAHLAQQGLDSVFLGECVVSTLVKCGGLEDALQVFHKLSYRTASSWTVIISGYAVSGQGYRALSMYQQMQREGVQPNAYTFVSLIKSCGIISDLKEGKQVHAEAVRYGCGTDLFVCTSLVDMYGRCGSISDARKVFDELPHRDVVLWNAMLAAYFQHGQSEKVLKLYENMQEDGISPDARTFVSCLQSCGMLAENEPEALVDGRSCKVNLLQRGRAIHAEVQRKGCMSNFFVGSTLVSMYGKCGSHEDAKDVFDRLSHQNVVSWNAMITAYVELGEAQKALVLYGQMPDNGVSPDAWTFVSALQACRLISEKENCVAVNEQHVKLNSFVKGKHIHAYAWRKVCDLDVLVGSALISMYGKCGSILDAEVLLHELPLLSIVSCNAMLALYVEQDHAEKAMQLYEEMSAQSVSLDDRSFVSAFQACGMLAEKESDCLLDMQLIKVNSLGKGKALHVDAHQQGYASDVFVGSTLVRMYGKCRSIMDAKNVFDGLPEQDVVSYNALLAVYVQQGEAERALELYADMSQMGMNPNKWTFVCLFQACGLLAEKEVGVVVDGKSTKLTSLGKGRGLHLDAQEKGYSSDLFVGTTLISMYGKCGSILDAETVFNGLSHPGVVAWTAMLAAYVEQGEAENALQLYKQMQRQGVSPDARTFVCALQACSIQAGKDEAVLEGLSAKVESLEEGKAIHADIQRKGYNSDVFVGNSLITMYGKCGSISDALSVFFELTKRDVVSYNAVLAAYVKQGEADQALCLYEQMLQEGISSNDRTFVSTVQACGMLAKLEAVVVVAEQSITVKSLQMVKMIHAHVQKGGHDSDVFVGNTLISVYSNCGSIADAQNVFDGLLHRDVVSWNLLLVAYVEQGQVEKSFQLYEVMLEEGLKPSDRTYVSILEACGKLAEKEASTFVHGQPIKVKSLGRVKAIRADARIIGNFSDTFTGSTLVGIYGKCGSVVDACNAFHELSERDVVAWTALLGAYVEVSQGEQALQLYEKMREEGVSPDDFTFVSALQACAMLGEEEDNELVDGLSTKIKYLERGKGIHAEAWRKGYNSSAFVGSTLVSIYSKCGSMGDAESVFDGLPKRDMVSWTTMLAAYADSGEGAKALLLYKDMQKHGVKLDDIALVCLLQACSSTGGLDIVRHIHDTLVSSRVKLDPFLGSALINAYGRCGHMVEAQTVFDTLPQLDGVTWNAIIAGYARQGNSAATLKAYEDMLFAGVKPSGVTFVSLLYACSNAGLVEKGVEFFESMTRNHNITPGIGHYGAMVDLLGRAGCFSRVEALYSTMPMQPTLAMWVCLLGACRKHGDVVRGKHAFDSAVRLAPQHAAAYVLMSNIYSDAGLWDLAAEVNALEEKAGTWKKPSGQSWIDYEQQPHTFSVGDHKHLQHNQLHDIVQTVRSKLEESHNPICIVV